MQCPVKFVRMAGVSCIILAAVMPSGALAYHPLATDDTGTQGLAGNQLELGYYYAHSKVAGVADIGREIPLTFTRGLSDGLDVFAGIARVTSPTAGWGNPGVGLKWRFFENEASKFSLALKPEVRLPVSTTKEAAGLGNGKTSYGLTLIATRETGFGELHFNLAAERDNFDAAAITDQKSRYRLSLAPVWGGAIDFSQLRPDLAFPLTRHTAFSRWGIPADNPLLGIRLKIGPHSDRNAPCPPPLKWFPLPPATAAG